MCRIIYYRCCSYEYGGFQFYPLPIIENRRLIEYYSSSCFFFFFLWHSHSLRVLAAIAISFHCKICRPVLWRYHNNWVFTRRGCYPRAQTPARRTDRILLGHYNIILLCYRSYVSVSNSHKSSSAITDFWRVFLCKSPQSHAMKMNS